MDIVTDDDIFEATVRSLLGGSMGPPKYIYRAMVRGLVIDVAKRRFADTDLPREPKIVERITDRVMEAVASLDLYIYRAEEFPQRRHVKDIADRVAEAVTNHIAASGNPLPR